MLLKSTLKDDNKMGFAENCLKTHVQINIFLFMHKQYERTAKQSFDCGAFFKTFQWKCNNFI